MKGAYGRDVSSFDWERLSCVHGSAREVPQWFDRLLDEDDDVSMEALETLNDLLFHQDDVSEATAAFVLASEDELRSPVGERRCEVFFDLFASFAHAARSFDLGQPSEREAALAAVLRNEPIAGAHGSMNTLAAARAQRCATRARSGHAASSRRWGRPRPRCTIGRGRPSSSGGANAGETRPAGS